MQTTIDSSGAFDDETIQALKELGQALRAVYDRLIAEGYTLIDGKYLSPPIKWQDRY